MNATLTEVPKPEERVAELRAVFAELLDAAGMEGNAVGRVHLLAEAGRIVDVGRAHVILYGEGLESPNAAQLARILTNLRATPLQRRRAWMAFLGVVSFEELLATVGATDTAVGPIPDPSPRPRVSVCP